MFTPQDRLQLQRILDTVKAIESSLAAREYLERIEALVRELRDRVQGMTDADVDYVVNRIQGSITKLDSSQEK